MKQKKYKKIIKQLFILLLLICIGALFIHINAKNYGKHVQIRDNYVNHPESLPKPDIAKLSSFGFSNLRADLYWLQTIQYIGGNAVSSDYKKYLYTITDITTELNPFFEHPYTITQLLLPSENKNYENLSAEESQKYTDQAETIGLKGIRNFCDLDKIEKILAEPSLLKIWENEDLKDPCKNYKIPYYLAYIYYYYKNEPAKASDYYKITSANSDALSGAKTMAAIMAGKGGDREKSIFMFLNIAQSLGEENDQCSIFSEKINNLSKGIFLKKEISLTGEVIQAIQEARLEFFGEFGGDDDSKSIGGTTCISFLQKANRELNLSYIEAANEKYKQDHNGENAEDGQELFDNGYINFLPTDFQQYDGYGIIYQYKPETGFFDNEMVDY
ncbi:MAG: hypothetical protein GY828_00985 [Candidatus Gracilibacteria bacterium]|nr:hypothetical protein [Candidatus Gracilibacteria bacterium]